jgi:predicted SAM-dependent methyltransferase
VIKRLQIGSGKAAEAYRTPEWINIDLVRHKPRGHFVVADGCALPFPSGRFETIHAIHVLEHMPRDGHLPFLREIGRTLTNDGMAWIEVPDFLSVCRKLMEAVAVDDQEEVRIRTVGIYGKGRHHGDWHHWGFAPWYLENLFAQAGLRCERSYDMISGHHKQEPVLLYRCRRG